MSSNTWASRLTRSGGALVRSYECSIRRRSFSFRLARIDLRKAPALCDLDVPEAAVDVVEPSIVLAFVGGSIAEEDALEAKVAPRLSSGVDISVADPNDQIKNRAARPMTAESDLRHSKAAPSWSYIIVLRREVYKKAVAV